MTCPNFHHLHGEEFLIFLPWLAFCGEWDGGGFYSCVSNSRFNACHAFVILCCFASMDGSRSRPFRIICISYQRTRRTIRCFLRMFFLSPSTIILSQCRRLTILIPNTTRRHRQRFRTTVLRNIIRRIRRCIHSIRLVRMSVQVFYLRISISHTIVLLSFRNRYVNGTYRRVIHVRLLRLRNYFLTFRRQRLRRLFRRRTRSFHLIISRPKSVLRRVKTLHSIQILRRLYNGQSNQGQYLRFIHRVISGIVLRFQGSLLARRSVGNGSGHCRGCRQRSS